MYSKTQHGRTTTLASGGPPMDHFTVDQTCKHEGCEMAIMYFVIPYAVCITSPTLCTIHEMLNTPSPNQAEHLCLRLQLLLDLAAVLNALQNVLTVLIDLQFGDNNLRRVNADGDGLARGFVLGDSFDVDDVFETVDRGDLSFAALIGASDNEDFVIFADGDRSNIVLLTKFFA